MFGPSPRTFTRKVINVRPACSSYRVEVAPPSGVGVEVIPEMIVMKELKQTVTYNVTFWMKNGGESIGRGFLRWVSYEHSVRSSIAVVFTWLQIPLMAFDFTPHLHAYS